MNRKYLINLLLAAIITAVGIFCWNYFIPKFSNDHAWFILVYYIVVTAAIHQWLVKHVEPKKFVRSFMGITSLKLLLNLIVILIYGFTLRDKAVSFALLFMLIYFVFTFFESSQLIKSFNQKKEKS
jgi:hypothetical protein